MPTFIYYIFPFLPTTISPGLALFLKIFIVAAVAIIGVLWAKLRAITAVLDLIKPALRAPIALNIFTFLRTVLYITGFVAAGVLAFVSITRNHGTISLGPLYLNVTPLAFMPYIIQVVVSLCLTKRFVQAMPVACWGILLLTISYAVPIDRQAIVSILASLHVS